MAYSPNALLEHGRDEDLRPRYAGFCESCSGAWFDRNELAEYLGLTRDLVDFPNLESQAKSAALACPKCSTALFEMLFSVQPDSLIDWCEGCGGTFSNFSEVAKAQSVAADLESSSVWLKVIQERFFKKRL